MPLSIALAAVLASSKAILTLGATRVQITLPQGVRWAKSSGFEYVSYTVSDHGTPLVDIYLGDNPGPTDDEDYRRVSVVGCVDHSRTYVIGQYRGKPESEALEMLVALRGDLPYHWVWITVPQQLSYAQMSRALSLIKAIDFGGQAVDAC